MFSRSLIVLRTIPRQPRILISSHIQLPAFSSSVPQASGDPKISEESIKAFTKTETYQKVFQNPETRFACKNVFDVLNKQGVDLTSGKKPSFKEMSQLLFNSQAREAISDLAKALKKAGIEEDPQKFLEDISKLPGAKKDP